MLLVPGLHSSCNHCPSSPFQTKEGRRLLLSSILNSSILHKYIVLFSVQRHDEDAFTPLPNGPGARLSVLLEFVTSASTLCAACAIIVLRTQGIIVYRHYR